MLNLKAAAVCITIPKISLRFAFFCS